MKIGIVTFTNTLDNYGQVFQYLAIQEFLKQRGHSVYLLRQGKPGFLYAVLRALKRLLKKEQPKIVNRTIYDDWLDTTKRLESAHPRHFESFRKKQCSLTYTDLPYLAKGVFDGVAVGSDQVWSGTTAWNYLAFFKGNTKKFTLAPSTGNQEFSIEAINKIRPWLNDFDFITVREESGIDLCKSAGYTKAKCVLDPTFLISNTIYTSFCEPFKLPTRKYILLYMLGAETNISVKDIYEFANNNDLDIVYVASQGRDDSYPKLYASVGQWLYAIQHAEYVITNSFHGMALSIIFHKQFVTLPIVGSTKKMNERIESIANRFELKNRFCNSSLDVLLTPIDYAKTDVAIENNKSVINELLVNIGF